MGTHANTNNTDLRDLGIAADTTGTQFSRHTLKDVFSTLEIIAMNGKRESCAVILANVLNNHVHANIGFAYRLQNTQRTARGIRHSRDSDFGFITIKSDAGDDRLFHGVVILKSNQGAFTFLEAGKNP